MNELQDFIELSKYAGERYDLIQAGGGNTSVKFENKMYIKASGVYLSEVENDYGYAIVENDKILDVFNDENILCETDKRKKDLLSSQQVSASSLTEKFRPSIETLMHSILKKYTLHSHPIVVNSVACGKDWKEIFTNLFNNEVLLIDYKTPGFELAVELNKKIKNKNSKIIILQNHGLIVTSDFKDEVKELTEFVVDKISQYLGINMSDYKLTNELSAFINSLTDEKYTSYMTNDKYLIDNISSEFINSKPFCPDKMVYCGTSGLVLDDEPIKLIQKYKNLYHSIPKVLVYKNNLFFVAKNVKKAKEIEDIFKFHIMSLKLAQTNNINYLDDNEILYLANWEAEKYRQSLK